MEAELGHGVSADYRALCETVGLVECVLAAETRDRSEEEFGHLVDVVGEAQKARDATRVHLKAEPIDKRWSLIRDLMQEDARGADWAPVQFERAQASGRVVLSFDDRVSLRALLSEVRRTWPQLRAKGLIRQTRRLNDRTVALVRFVCLDCDPGMTWRQRWVRWNATNPAWAWTDHRQMHTAFRRAESSIAGKDGLRRFYDPPSPGLWLALSESVLSGPVDREALLRAISSTQRAVMGGVSSEEAGHAVAQLIRTSSGGTTGSAPR